MTDQQQALALLASIPEIGCRTLQRLISHAEQNGIRWQELFHAVTSQPNEWGLSTLQQVRTSEFVNKNASEEVITQLIQQNIQVVTIFDDTYPTLLRQIPDYPVVLFVQSRSKITAPIGGERPVAVVGTRKITPYGVRATQAITQQLCEFEIPVVSGGMYGVDFLAHQTAIAAASQTVVVLGFGHGCWYPRSFQSRAEKLLADGAVFVSEYPPLLSPTKGTFRQRNRIVAGMSWGVVVVEAAPGSGSFITADCALEYHRTVMAVPGPFDSIYSLGTKRLLNQGAELVCSGVEVVKAIVSEVEWQATTNSQQEQSKAKSWFSPVQQQILALLRQESFSDIELTQYIQLESHLMARELLLLSEWQVIELFNHKWRYRHPDK